MSKWINSTLEEICLKEKGSIISGPFGSNISSKFFVEEGVPVIRGNNLSLDFRKFVDDNFVFVTVDKANELKCDAIENDLIFTAAGTIGQVGIIPHNAKYKRYVISNKQIRARLDDSIIDREYAYCWYASPWICKLLQNSNKGSTVPLLTLAEVRSLPIRYPQKRSEQQAIAGILNNLSEKITTNNAISSQLEDMAKLIYDYWFVQFDFPDENGRPYKSSGGKMVWNDDLKREIPEGWEVCTLSDIVYYSEDKIDAKLLSDDTYIGTDNLLPNMQGKEKSQYVPSYGEVTAFTYGDCLIANIRPYFQKIWYSNINGGCSADVLCLKSFNSNLSGYVYYTCARDDFFIYDMQGATGSKMPRGDKKHIMNYPIIHNKKIAKLFSSNVVAILDMKNKLYEQNQQLASLRDFLLPMLMNGQVKIQ